MAFAIHGLLVSNALAFQVTYYNGFRTSPLSKATILLIVAFVLSSGKYKCDVGVDLGEGGSGGGSIYVGKIRYWWID